jgi:hypothetical protein
MLKREYVGGSVVRTFVLPDSPRARSTWVGPWAETLFEKNTSTKNPHRNLIKADFMVIFIIALISLVYD